MPKLKLWCAVPSCYSDSRKSPNKYPFMKGEGLFPFPSIKESKPLDYSPTPWHRVCSRHFEDNADNADIPTLFQWNNYGIKTTC
ncbi:hypothetical protein KUTeg_021307, partial [Tegillarca granosa]